MHAEVEGGNDLTLDLTCSIPADGHDVDSGTLVARVYEYDPLLADASAAKVDEVAITGLTHREGRDTVLRLPLHAKRVPRMNYYLTVFIYPGASPKETRRLYFIDGFQKVFEGTAEQSLSIKLTPVGR